MTTTPTSSELSSKGTPPGKERSNPAQLSQKVTEKKDENYWATYLLIAIIIASVGWVCFWTAIATHTDLARRTIYPALETKFFQGKSGARTFTYLGVFYIWIGAVTYTALYYGLRLPKPAPWAVRTFRVPVLKCNLSVLEAAAVFLVVAIQIATFVARVENRFEVPYWPSERISYEISKTLGKTVGLTLMLILFPVSKNCFWWDLFNFQFERAVKFHRWLAWLLVWVVIAHAVTALVPLFMVGQFRNCMWPNSECEKPGGWGTYEGLKTSRIYTYGWLAFVFAIPLVVTSLPWFRRRKFEWFYYTHFLFVPFFIMAHLHYPDLIYYMAPGLSAYVLDKVVWYCSSRRRTRLVNLTIPAPGFVRISIALDKDHAFEPGQWVQINIPAVSYFEWHPMSIASAPDHTTMAIDVKVLGDWTEKLYSLARHFDPSEATYVFVDKFHGSSHLKSQGYLNHPVVAMFGGGIGVTPMMSALRKLVESSEMFPGIRKVVFVWCVKKKSVLDLYRHELAKYQSLTILPSGCELEVIVHATLSEPENEDKQDCETSPDDRPALQVDQEGPGPFMQHVMGYGHQLVLTLGAGGGFLLGILIANVLSHDQKWRSESKVMLQLLLAVLVAAGLVAVAMLRSSFRPTRPWVPTDEESDGTRFSYVNAHKNNLEVVLGCRPNVPEILQGLTTYCETNNFRSVGVSVCGPEQLVAVTVDSARAASESSVEFVVDEETFDW